MSCIFSVLAKTKAKTKIIITHKTTLKGEKKFGVRGEMEGGDDQTVPLMYSISHHMCITDVAHVASHMFR